MFISFIKMDWFLGLNFSKTITVFPMLGVLLDDTAMFGWKPRFDEQHVYKKRLLNISGQMKKPLVCIIATIHSY